MSAKARDRIGSIVLLVFVAVLWLQRDYMTPFGGMFPDLVMVVLAAVLLATLILSFTSHAASAGGPEKAEGGRVDWVRIAVVAVILVAWGALLRPLGFAVTGVLGFTALSLYTAGPARSLRELARTLVLAALVTGLLMLVFGRLLQVPLPTGTLWS